MLSVRGLYFFLKYAGEEDGSQRRREKLHRHTAINLRTSGYYFNSQVSGRVSSQKRRPLSQPAAQKEKWPSDLIYERTNIARPWTPLSPSLSFSLVVRAFPPSLLSQPRLLVPLPRFVFARRICDGGHRMLGAASRESRERWELSPVINDLRYT